MLHGVTGGPATLGIRYSYSRVVVTVVKATAVRPLTVVYHLAR